MKVVGSHGMLNGLGKLEHIHQLTSQHYQVVNTPVHELATFYVAIRRNCPNWLPLVPRLGLNWLSRVMQWLEDHPRTCKWLINHADRKSHKDRVVGPLPNFLNGLYMGVTNYLLNGMFLQVIGAVAAFFFCVGFVRKQPGSLGPSNIPFGKRSHSWLKYFPLNIFNPGPFFSQPSGGFLKWWTQQPWVFLLRWSCWGVLGVLAFKETSNYASWSGSVHNR